MGRLMGINFKRKFVGISISDKTQSFAWPKEVIKYTQFIPLINRIKQIAEQEKIVKIIVNLPQQNTMLYFKVVSFTHQLRKHVKIPVIPVTFPYAQNIVESIIPTNTRKKEKITEKLLSAIILQDYINQKHV